MSQWKPYSPEEVHDMAQQNRRRLRTDFGERFCSSCGRLSLRFYYHELSKTGRIGSSYFWCPNCKKAAHSTGPRLSGQFDYNDPFDELGREEFGKMEAHNWYDHLDTLWDSKTLPQIFKEKPKN
jgi:hypothetical protein